MCANVPEELEENSEWMFRQTMIRKSVKRFSKRSCSNVMLNRSVAALVSARLSRRICRP